MHYRWSRVKSDHLTIRATLARLGVAVVSVTEPLDDTTPAGRFIESVLASVAQFDNDVRRERVMAGMKAATGDWRFPHKGPLGYLNGSKKKHEPSLLPDPFMGPLVRQAFEAIDVGEQPNDVRRTMEKRGLVGPSGRLVPGTFYGLLSNRAYVGLVETNSAFQGNDLRELSRGDSGLVDQRGFEPLTS